MTRSEFYKPAGLKGEKPVPSILVDADKLLGLILRAELMMNAKDRRRYSDRAVNLILEVIEEFTLAYDFEDERYHHLKRMWCKITSLIHLMRQIGKVDAIRIHPKYETMTPDQMKIELMNTIASLDEGATSWKKSVVRTEKERRKSHGNKGMTGSDGWNRQSPEE